MGTVSKPFVYGGTSEYTIHSLLAHCSSCPLTEEILCYIDTD